jgi:hypothetical protein
MHRYLPALVFALATPALAATPEGSPFPDTPYLHHSGLKVKKKVEPTYPDSATEADRRMRHRCIVWTRVGPKGEVEQATVVPEFPGADCTAPFQQAAAASVREWRFKGQKVEGEKASVHTQIAVVFLAEPSDPLVDVSLEGSPPPEPVPQPRRPQAGKPVDGE